MKLGGAIIVVAILILVANPVFAHPGNTAADGCHYCRTNCDYWGVPWNERHCHNGSIPTVNTNTTTSPTISTILGDEDVEPKITSLSHSILKPSKLKGQTTITVYGKDFSRSDVFKLNTLTLSRKFMSSSKVNVTIPYSKLRYKTYTLRLYHEGVSVSSKKLVIKKP
ncbi:MAG: hypothetical protein V1685_03115 [Parcubacteria group bacterium]